MKLTREILVAEMESIAAKRKTLGKDAQVQINAPLAMHQAVLEGQIAILKHILNTTED